MASEENRAHFPPDAGPAQRRDAASIPQTCGFFASPQEHLPARSVSAYLRRMATLLESVAELEDEDQTTFNIAVWEAVLADPALLKLPFRIETDHNGQIIMTPPAAYEHGAGQFDIGQRIAALLPDGRVAVESPISTSDGVKVADVTWISMGRQQGQTAVCLTAAPEICVEVLSPNNTRREMREKRALYFEAGADEVWFCERDGRMEFFLKGDPTTPAASKRCPTFPACIGRSR